MSDQNNNGGQNNGQNNDQNNGGQDNGGQNNGGQNNGGQNNGGQNNGDQENQGGDKGGQAKVKTYEEAAAISQAAWEALEKDPSKPELKEAYKKALNDEKAVLAAEREAVKGKQPPSEYKLAKPEKSLLSDEAVKGIALFAKEQGLTQAQAQAQVDRESQILSQVRQSVASEGEAAMLKNQESWITTAKDDKEYGGAELPKNMELAKRVLKKYGTPEFNAILEDPKQGKFGNHPELVRVLVRIGKAMSDDQLVISSAQGNNKPKSAADKLYGEGTVKGSGVKS